MSYELVLLDCLEHVWKKHQTFNVDVEKNVSFLDTTAPVHPHELLNTVCGNIKNTCKRTCPTNYLSADMSKNI